MPRKHRPQQKKQRPRKDAVSQRAFEQAMEQGSKLEAEGRYEEACTAFRAAVSFNPTHALGYNNLGATLLSLGKLPEAATVLRQAIARDPKMSFAYSNLGAALTELEEVDDALDALTRAVALNPSSVGTLINLSTAYRAFNRPEEAVAVARQALELNPQSAGAMGTLGAALYGLGQLDEAVAANRAAVALDPDSPKLRKNLGLLLLHVGYFAEGWAEYEWRWAADRLARNYAKPTWQGEPLAGKTILLYGEQGMGDVIHFARFVPILAAAGARVILEVHAPLVRLMRSLQGVTEVIPLLGQVPPIDYQRALMSVPGVLGITLDTIPASVPYLAAEPDRVALWRGRIGEHGFKVGVVWQGKGDTVLHKTRSAPLACLAPLAKIEGVRLISLQKDAGELDPTVPVEVLGPDFDAGPGAFLDTAAVMQLMDLVVTIDSATAHLAGALGIPVWIALKYVPDWRWMSDRATSPWYPTAQLFRQKVDGAWESVFVEMAEMLRDRDRLASTAVNKASKAMRNYARWDRFFDVVAPDVYAEQPSPLHERITKVQIEELHRAGVIRAGMRVLDVSCGQGLALEQFREIGLVGIGVTLGPDCAVCKAKGLDVREMDQNFLDFLDGTFDVLWCRHVLEHCVAPFFTLSEYWRLTKPGGLVYIEVPAPDTSAHHEANPHHYSVLPQSAWLNLFARVGFVMEKGVVLDFTTGTGPDAFWSFRLRRSP